ncbi:MAG: NADH-quinone oxidoreductase subunit L, partial [Firmicutes bacterium]|nr:NADH-quinone oxidoreductase subunit L [Bacillota bacterium]
MLAVPFLICFPFVVAFVLMFVKKTSVHSFIAYIGASLIAAGVGALAIGRIMGGMQPIRMYYETEIADKIIFGGEIALMLLVVFLCFKYNKKAISLLSVIPTAIIAAVEFRIHTSRTDHICVDRLSMMMCLIIGVVGSLIIVYAVGYMTGYHQHHKE